MGFENDFYELTFRNGLLFIRPPYFALIFLPSHTTLYNPLVNWRLQ